MNLEEDSLTCKKLLLNILTGQYAAGRRIVLESAFKGLPDCAKDDPSIRDPVGDSLTASAGDLEENKRGILLAAHQMSDRIVTDRDILTAFDPDYQRIKKGYENEAGQERLSLQQREPKGFCFLSAPF